MSADKIIFEHILGQMEPIFYSPYKDISFEWLIVAGQEFFFRIVAQVAKSKIT